MKIAGTDWDYLGRLFESHSDIVCEVKLCHNLA